MGDETMKAQLERIMELQPQWSHRKTPEMDERGQLVRHTGPEWLRTFSETLADALGIPHSDLLIEGRDGTGPKTEVPWFRFASRQRSPSATMDWYCVYLFDTQGQSAYLSLAHGSTDWTGVDFRPRPVEELHALGRWGRTAVLDISVHRPELSEAMELHSRRSNLGPAYEAGTAVCLRYDRAAVPDSDTLREDALFFAQMLRAVYSAATVIPPPVGTAPEVAEVIEVAQRTAGKASPLKGGQGFRASAEQRSAVERHAMSVVETHLRTNGWEVEDTSATKPYDFFCVSNDSELFVEVKGTTSSGETVVLTRNEVEFHRNTWPNNSLAIVSGITLSGKDGLTASGGQLTIVQPWSIEDERLQVVSYLYRLSPDPL